MPPSLLSAAEKAEARRLYLEHPELSVDALAGSYGVTRQVMLRVLHGITRPRGGRDKTTVSAETMIQMRDKGMTLGEIGREVGLTESGVYRRIKKYEKERSTA